MFNLEAAQDFFEFLIFGGNYQESYRHLTEIRFAQAIYWIVLKLFLYMKEAGVISWCPDVNIPVKE